MLPKLGPIVPELVVIIGAIASLMIGVYRRNNPDRGMSWLAVVIMAVAVALLFNLGGDPVVTFNGMFVTNSFIVFSKVLVLVGAALTLIMSGPWLRAEQINRFEYPVLILFATAGMMMMISANNLISLYLGLELQSLSLYVLAAFQRDNSHASEAGLKYFVLGSLASGLLLYGSSLVYGFAGTTGFEGLAQVLTKDAPIGAIIGMVFILAGLAFKVSAVPFHMWTPDVYEGAPTPVTAFFSVAPKIAAFVLLLRVMVGPFGGLTGEWQQVVMIISGASMILGSFAAIAQKNIKRLMAYSSIGHVGYALIGLAVGTKTGVQGVLVYLSIYLFMNVGTFAVILAMRRKGRPVEGIEDLAGLSKTHPGMALALAIFMFSMAGIPPLAGFWSKLAIFMSAIDAGLYTLAVIGVLTSVVGAYYYLRLIKVMYFDEPADSLDRGVGSMSVGVIMTLSAIAIVAFTLIPSPLINGAGLVASALFKG